MKLILANCDDLPHFAHSIQIRCLTAGLRASVRQVRAPNIRVGLVAVAYPDSSLICQNICLDLSKNGAR